MSLLRRKRYSARLTPSAVTLAELEGIVRPAPWMVAVLPAPTDVSWTVAEAVAEMDRHFTKQGGRRGSIDIVLADAFVRYAVLPWSEKLSGQQEVEALARIRLEELFGTAVAAWDIVVDRREFGHGGLVCAVAPNFPNLLRECCAAHNLTLRSLMPDFMERYNRLRGQIKAIEFLYASVADGRCQIAYRNDTGWHSMRAVSMREHSAEALTDILQREILLQDCPDNVGIYLDLPESWLALRSDLAPHYHVLPFAALNRRGGSI
ncbi:hypothetical protein GTP91_24825 [Rugamonas sp. FT82W]|uniref:Uncharacterized protein n=1 Tax=Duganella vulcania TaxID=2692166 RepID=A0A845G6R7_9BURK|nr:hypothetical protein [Duganella vulcania]MYM90383.1 hypothetical protein [Duganella vulcania]